MSQPVNLNRFRKAKARAERQARAEENAVKFGRSKADKAADAKTSDSQARHLDGHKRDT
jgi:hypothetical protein